MSGVFGKKAYFTMRFLLTILLVGCSSSRHSTVTSLNVPDISHRWVIDDTFFYRRDSSVLQYPREIKVAGLTVRNCWFADSGEFIIIREPDTTSEIICDTDLVQLGEDEFEVWIECHYSNNPIVKRYTIDRNDFRYLKLTP